jgi:hypothetical protein
MFIDIRQENDRRSSGAQCFWKRAAETTFRFAPLERGQNF